MSPISSNIFQRRFATIHGRLFLAFVLLVLLPAAAISISSILVDIQGGREQAFEKLESVASLKENEIRTWLQNLQIDLLALTEDEVYKKAARLLSGEGSGNPAEQDKAEIYSRFVQVIELTKRFDEFFLMSRRGILVLSTEPFNTGEFRGLQPYFREGLKRPGVHVQSAAYSSASEKLNNVIAVQPVFNSRGEAVGVMCGVARFRTLNTRMGERTGLGQTGETYLVGSNHVLITVSRFPGFTLGMSAIYSHAINAGLEKRESGRAVYDDYRGKPAIGVYRWMPEIDAVLIAEQHREEAYQTIYTTLGLNAIMAVVAVLLAGFVSLSFTHGIAAPLASLAGTATRIANGNLELTAKVEGPEEVRSAARSFNLMTERLRRRIQMEELTSATSRKFIDLAGDEADRAILCALKDVAVFAGADRVSVFLFSQDGMTVSVSHQWCAEGIPACEFREHPVEENPWYFERIKNFEPVHVPDVESLPPEAPVEKENWTSLGVKSLARVPVTTGKNIRGYIGFDSLREKRVWSEEDIQLLRMIGEIICRTLERVWFEKTLASQKERLAVTLRSIGDAVITADVDGKVVLMNRAAEQLTLWRQEEAIGRPLGEVFRIIGEKTREVCAGPVEMVLKTDLIVNLATDTVLVSPDGSEKIIEASGAPIREGDRIVGVVLVFRDVTERRRAEEERIRLATAIEQSAEAIFVTDPNWIIQYVNPALEHMTGYSMDEIIGRHTRILKSDKHDQSFYRSIRRSLESGGAWSGRLINRRKDGSLYEAEVTGSPVRDKQGNIINYVSIHRDITHEVRLEKELRQAQKMEAIGRLAGGIAHDFNNILAAIIGFTEMASAKIPGESPARRNLEQVLKASSRAADLVARILTYSRKTDAERKPVRIAPIVTEVLRFLRSSLPATIEIRQDTAINPDEGIIMADSTQIHQVLMNLCTNAGHAMASKGGVLSVAASKVEVDDYLVSRFPGLRRGPCVKLTVSDTGCGIDSAIMDRIFDPYFTTKGPGEGTGMGLAVVQGIVKSHGGAISVYSEPGYGSSFNLFFPMITETVDEKSEITDTILTGSESILFIDDEQNLAALGEEMLQALGYRVTACASSLEALKIFRQSPGAFDLVITDMTMPGLTGSELASRILKIRDDIPIILCTGFSELINEKQAREIGICRLLLKPYVISNIAAAVRMALDNKNT